MIPLPMISLGFGLISGFIFKLMANAQQDRAELHKNLIETIKTKDNSANQALQRAPGKAGETVRRLIVLSILFGVILAPFLIIMFTDKTVIVESTTPLRSWFGLFSTGGKTTYYELHGYLLSEGLMSSLICIISFYFGQASGKRT